MSFDFSRLKKLFSVTLIVILVFPSSYSMSSLFLQPSLQHHPKSSPSDSTLSQIHELSSMTHLTPLIFSIPTAYATSSISTTNQQGKFNSSNTANTSNNTKFSVSLSNGTSVNPIEKFMIKNKLISWAKQMQHVHAPHTGCFVAHYPGTSWQPIQCAKTPPIHLPPGHPTLKPKYQVEAGIEGGGNDFEANAPAGQTITSSQGTLHFFDVTSENDVATPSPNSSTKGPNAFSLQLNTENTLQAAYTKVTGTANYGSSWVQFVFANDPNGGGYGLNGVLIEYWVKNYLYDINGNKLNNQCPNDFPGISPYGWQKQGSDCVANTETTPFSVPTISDMDDTSLSGSIQTDDHGQLDDVATFCPQTGSCAMEAVPDYVVNLSLYWQHSQFNIYGNDDYDEANFNDGATIEIENEITTNQGTGQTPNCDNHIEYTGESNNLAIVPLYTVDGSSVTCLNSVEGQIQFVESNISPSPTYLVAVKSGNWNDPTTWGLSRGAVAPLTIYPGITVLIPEGLTVTIPFGIRVSNADTIFNSGTIVNYGVIYNEGRGIFVNSGTLRHVFPNALFFNEGSFTNNGQVEIIGNVAFNVSLGSPGLGYTGVTTFVILSGDQLIVKPGITLTIPSGYTLENSGTISNLGAISNSGIIQHVFPTASFSNSGTFTNNGQVELVGTVQGSANLSSLGYPGVTNFVVNQNDELTVDSGNLLYPFYTEGRLTIPPGYTLTNSGTILTDPLVKNCPLCAVTILPGIILNYGTISNLGAISNSGTISNYGDICPRGNLPLKTQPGFNQDGSVC